MSLFASRRIIGAIQRTKDCPEQPPFGVRSRVENGPNGAGRFTNPGIYPDVREMRELFSRRLVSTNPAREVRKEARPKAKRAKIEVLREEEARHVLTMLRGKPMFPIAALGLGTGMRRGEMLALRWCDTDLDAAELKVSRSLEQTKEGLRFKEPKSDNGCRTIFLPSIVVAELRTHKAAQLARRMALGLGKLPEDALVFCKPDGSELAPDSVSDDWRRHVRTLKLPPVSLHALRHTHASQLIASGMDILTISRRLGHGKTSVTLDVYGHLFKPTDRDAAAVFDQAFGTL